jgi:Flp pilus assembly protein TadG
MRLSKFTKSEHGAALVEFALVAPILFLLVFGIVDFGRALFTLNNLTSAVREGARFAAVQSAGTTQATVRQQVQNYLAEFGGDPVDPNSILMNPSTITTATVCVRVWINGYQFQPITPLPRMIGLGTISMSPSAVFRWEQTTSTATCPPP